MHSRLLGLILVVLMVAPSRAHAAVKGVVVLAHGLNFRPETMFEMGEALKKMDQDVRLVKLTGHHGDHVDFGKVTRNIWLADFEKTYRLAKRSAQKHRVPLTLVGFSLGALLGIDLMAQNRVVFDRMVLLAPAIAVRPRSKLILSMSIFGKQFRVPSLSSRDYRANDGTSIAAYRAVFDSVNALKEQNLAKANIPTLVFIDPSDELVSVRGIQKLVQKNHLNRWNFDFVSNEYGTLRPSFHHLIIDERTLGRREWNVMLMKIKRLLN